VVRMFNFSFVSLSQIPFKNYFFTQCFVGASEENQIDMCLAFA